MHYKGYSSSLFPHLFKLFAKQPSDINVIDPYEIPILGFKENIVDWPENPSGRYHEF